MFLQHRGNQETVAGSPLNQLLIINNTVSHGGYHVESISKPVAIAALTHVRSILDLTFTIAPGKFSPGYSWLVLLTIWFCKKNFESLMPALVDRILSAVI